MTMRSIAFLVFPGFQILDLTGPLAAFEMAGLFAPDAYRLVTIAATAGAVASSSGLCIQAEALSRAKRCDTLIVVGGDGIRDVFRDTMLLRFVQGMARRTRRIASVCSGAYLLAAAGLLDGRAATTHWSRAADFARRFPDVRVEADRIFVRDGDIWTSAGISAGIDLALALVECDLGEDVARAAARQLVVYHRRPGGQSQFSALLDLAQPQSRFDALLHRARERLTERLSVEDLADEMAMSPRNFSRAFARETGTSPARAIERLRLEAARAALDNGVVSLAVVASQTGFGDADRMRRAFMRIYGRTPLAFRSHVTQPAALA
jgi:transcriptional regulator GlxA family with amidase domain